MLGKIVLLLIQIAAAWFIGPLIRQFVPVVGIYDLFLYALVFAVVVYLTGILCAQVLRGVGMPSGATLSAALVLGLIAAALITFLPQFIPDLPNATLSNRAIVLTGALIGYWIKR